MRIHILNQGKMMENNAQENEKSLSRQMYDTVSPATSLLPATAELLGKCGAVCKKIPLAGDVVDSILLYDETKSIRKALVRFGANTIGGIVDKPLVVVFIFDVELGIWTYSVMDDVKSFVEDKTNSFIDGVEDFFNVMFRTIDNGFRNWQNQIIFDRTGVWIGAYLDINKLMNARFAGGTSQMQAQYLSDIAYQQKILQQKPTFMLKPSTKEIDEYFNPYFRQIQGALENSKIIPIAFSTCNSNISKASYLQRIPQEDIESLTPNSPLHLLKALFFCEDYILLDSNKEPLLKESNWREFYNYKSDFYTIFIADKQTLTQDYLNTRKSLYKAIMQIRKEQQDKEIQELQRSQQELEQQLQGLDSKVRESKLQELQRKQERELKEKQRQKERQEQRQARFSKNLANTYNTSTTQNLTINNNAYITKDSYLVLESNDTKIIFLDSLKHTYTHSKDYANNYPDNTPISFSNLILQYNNQVTIFAKDNSIIDSKQIEQDFDIDVSNMSCDVYFYSLLLRGGKEDRDNPRFFYGEKGEVYMSDESDNIEVFYNDARLSMTNYYYHAYS